jgi:AraC-like DNA-binding protein
MTIASVGRFAHTPDWQGDPECESFAMPTVIFTLDGRWTIRQDGRTTQVDPSVVVVGHVCDYRCSHRERVPTDRTLYVELDVAEPALPDVAAVPASQRLRQIAAAFLSGDADSALARDGLALRLLAALHGTPGLDEPLRPSRDAIARTIDYLEEHYAEDVTLDRLASVANYSPFHLHRLFVERTGTTPHRYLRACRIERAKSLLARSDLAVARVAEIVGYASERHFSRVFAREVGVTPRLYSTSSSAASRSSSSSRGTGRVMNVTDICSMRLPSTSSTSNCSPS